MQFASRWILSRLSTATGAMVKAMHAYDFSTATQVSRPDETEME
jgi:hypothetical protein